MTLKVVAYRRSLYRTVWRFVRTQPYVHHHLEWRPVEVWLRDPQQYTLLAYQDETLVGVLSLAPPYENTAWLRLIALSQLDRIEVIAELFRRLFSYAQQYGLVQLAILDPSPWLKQVLSLVEFMVLVDIVHLRRPADLISPYQNDISWRICKVRRRDLPTIEKIDHGAFEPLWWMSLADFQEGFYYAGYFQAAYHGKEAIGYAYANQYPDSVHLVRLATQPTWRGRGVASSLLHDLIAFYPQLPITVNTQITNPSSLRLYERFGFVDENWRTEVWHYLLTD